jgi:1-acyl-sn-glycerol-3-phosphate acyltransferase
LIFLRSLAYNIFFWTWTAGLLVACLPLLLGPSVMAYHVGRVWAQVSLRALRVICGLDFEIRGHRNLPDRPCLIACKHQSAWDTLIFALLVRHPAIVLKRELLRIPLFGWFLAKADMVPVDRTAGAAALKAMLAIARERIAEGRSIVIYPEGTRTAPGENRPYHPGVYALYRDLDCPLVPVALNSGLYWRRNAFKKYPGTILLEILPPIEKGLGRKALMTRLKDRIEENTARLVKEAEGQA